MLFFRYFFFRMVFYILNCNILTDINIITELNEVKLSGHSIYKVTLIK